MCRSVNYSKSLDSRQSAATAGRRREQLWRERGALEEHKEAYYAKHQRTNNDRVYPLGARTLLPYLLKAARLYNRGVENVKRCGLTRHTFQFEALPAGLDGFRILHLSDPHFRQGAPELAAIARDVASGVECDLCVITGDFRYEHAGGFDHVIKGARTMLSGVHSRLGVFAVFGNHDRSSFLQPLEDLGIAVLRNEARRIDAGGPDASFWLAGADDPHYFKKHDLDLTLEDVPPEAFTLLLVHSPELALDAADRGVDLYLCGHTHWGQIQFPLVGAVLLNSRCPRRYCIGEWRIGAMRGYTSAGLGATDVPVRFNCPPSAALIELRKTPP